jgi:hypothetical protein
MMPFFLLEAQITKMNRDKTVDKNIRIQNTTTQKAERKSE